MSGKDWGSDIDIFGSTVSETVGKATGDMLLMKEYAIRETFSWI
jgi:uncharacterized protein YjbJ (UPF0337 family)